MRGISSKGDGMKRKMKKWLRRLFRQVFNALADRAQTKTEEEKLAWSLFVDENATGEFLSPAQWKQRMVSFFLKHAEGPASAEVVLDYLRFIISRESIRLEAKRTLARTTAVLNDAAYLRAIRPDEAHKFAPDDFADCIKWRQWSIDALAALDSGGQIPSMPE